MKHKEERLEYVCRYQTMFAKEWWKVVSSDQKKFNLDDPDGCQKNRQAKIFLKKVWWRRISHDLVCVCRGGFLIFRKLKLQFVSRRQKAADYVKMLNDLSLAQEGHRLRREEWIFQQGNATIHDTSITKKYLLEQKIRLLHHPACSPDLNPVEICGNWLLQNFMKVVSSTQQFLNLDTWEKYIRFNFRN